MMPFSGRHSVEPSHTWRAALWTALQPFFDLLIHLYNPAFPRNFRQCDSCKPKVSASFQRIRDTQKYRRGQPDKSSLFDCIYPKVFRSYSEQSSYEILGSPLKQRASCRYDTRDFVYKNACVRTASDVLSSCWNCWESIAFRLRSLIYHKYWKLAWLQNWCDQSHIGNVRKNNSHFESPLFEPRIF